MIYLVVALKKEAEPFIRHYHLKKDMSISAFSVYQNERMTLLISGVGKIKSAMAATFLLTQSSKKDILLVNVGICGSFEKKYPTGQLFFLHKITDHDTRRDYYPEVFSFLPIEGKEIRTFSVPVSKKKLPNIPLDLVDMEAAGIMEAAEHFLFSHQVLLLKIVSDFLEGERLSASLPEALIEAQLSTIDRVLSLVMDSFPKEYPDLEGLLLSCRQCGAGFRFSDTMLRQLENDIRLAYARGKDVSSIFSLYPVPEKLTKEEGKRIFESIRSELKKETV